MEVFSMLRYWRGGGGAKGVTADRSCAGSGTAIAVSNYDEGPFFDLEFFVPEEGKEGRSSNTSNEQGEGRESTATEIKWSDVTMLDPGRLSSNSSLITADGDDNEVAINDRLLSVEPSGAASIFNDALNGKHGQCSVFLLKSATRFRVFFLWLKKHSLMVPNGRGTEEIQEKAKHIHGRFFTVKFKVEEAPSVSPLTKDVTWKVKEMPDSGHDLTEKEGKRAKIVSQRYLKVIKPLYQRVSKRNAEKVSFSGRMTSLPQAKSSNGSSTNAVHPNAAPARQGSFPAGLRVTYNRLGRGRSSSVLSVLTQSQRSDDSSMQQQDGIQSAIAHCKQSLNT